MINISIRDLDKETLYPKVLQAIENICDEYSLQNDFGVLSMANQDIIDFLQSSVKPISVDFDCNIESEEIVFIYYSCCDVFEGVQQYCEDNILSKLSDKIVYQSDNKQIMFSIHVKPKFNLLRQQTKQVSIGHVQA